MVPNVGGPLVQWAVMSCDTFPGAMKVISHHINEIQEPDKMQVRSDLLTQGQLLMGMMNTIKLWHTLQSLLFHNQHQWFLFQQAQQQ